MEKSLNALATDLIEAYERADRNEFTEQMNRLDSTQQQRFAELVFAWLNHYAHSCTDECNEASVRFVTELYDLHCSSTGQHYFRDLFPFI